MSTATATAAVPPYSELLGQLGSVCEDRGLPGLAGRLHDLQSWISSDMAGFEEVLATVPRGASVVHRSAHHLLDLGGKHLRPMCVALAAKLGSGFGPGARQLAVAVELIHNATLLHDDVIDLGDTRRGAPTARTVYGNAASIFAGDWLLIEALKRVQAAKQPGLLDRTLATIEEMIQAEALQLENRGRVNGVREDYFRVVEGKTAALFRWGMYAGAAAGGLDETVRESLASFGMKLGMAFQLVDDVLDFTGNSQVTGKALFADLREGKMTYPLLLALERQPGVRKAIESIVALAPDQPIPDLLTSEVLQVLDSTNGVRDCMALAKDSAREAIECLASVPEGSGRDALVTVAEATVYREK